MIDHHDIRRALENRINALLTKDQSGHLQVPYAAMLSIVADECLRQMEWARAMYPAESVCDGYDGEPCFYDCGIESIAPEGWKP